MVNKKLTTKLRLPGSSMLSFRGSSRQRYSCARCACGCGRWGDAQRSKQSLWGCGKVLKKVFRVQAWGDGRLVCVDVALVPHGSRLGPGSFLSHDDEAQAADGSLRQCPGGGQEATQQIPLSSLVVSLAPRSNKKRAVEDFRSSTACRRHTSGD